MQKNNYVSHIKEILKKRKISATKICEDLGIHKATFSNLTNNKNKIIDIRFIIDIANYLKISIHDLYNFKSITDTKIKLKNELMNKITEIPENFTEDEINYLKNLFDNIDAYDTNVKNLLFAIDLIRLNIGDTSDIFLLREKISKLDNNQLINLIQKIL